MKFLQIFSKTPNYRKFNYAPRFFNPEEEERKERNRRIALEVQEQKHVAEAQPEAQDALSSSDSLYAYRDRMHGAFRSNRVSQKQAVKSDRSATMLRLLILLILTVGLILYLQFGTIALYGLAAIFIPLYIYSKFRNLTKKRSD
jgi:Flp pilus assembly protein TadB